MVTSLALYSSRFRNYIARNGIPWKMNRECSREGGGGTVAVCGLPLCGFIFLLFFFCWHVCVLVTPFVCLLYEDCDWQFVSSKAAAADDEDESGPPLW